MFSDEDFIAPVILIIISLILIIIIIPWLDETVPIFGFRRGLISQLQKYVLIWGGEKTPVIFLLDKIFKTRNKYFINNLKDVDLMRFVKMYYNNLSTPTKAELELIEKIKQ